jgi:CHAT domain-containing protein/tetratricopeptide (TPR) repeat protein
MQRLSCPIPGWIPVLALAILAIAAAPLAARQSDLDGRELEIRGLLDRRSYAQAESLARALLNDARRRQGDSSVAEAEAIDLLVESLWRAGRGTAPDALALAERALAIRTKQPGQDSLDLAVSLRNLAWVLMVGNDLTRAKPPLDRASSIRLGALGAGHLKVGESTVDQGVWHSRNAEFAEALALLERGLAIYEKTLEPEDDRLARTALLLGSVLSAMGDFARAEQFYRRALVIREKALGADHPDVATCLSYLGSMRALLGDRVGALEYQNRALAALEKSLGPDHPDVGRTLTALSEIYWELQDLGTARRLAERALAILEKAYGRDGIETTESRSRLIGILVDSGDYEGARSLAEFNLGVRRKLLPPDHPDIAVSLNALAAIHQGLGDTRQARILYAESLAIRERSLGPDHFRVALALNNLATAVEMEGDPDSAIVLNERALAIYEKTLGPQDPDLAQALYTMSNRLVRLGRAREARSYEERAIAIYESTFGPEHPYTGRSLAQLAVIRYQNGDRQGAIEDALRAERIGRDHFQITVRSHAEREALQFANVRTSGLDLALTLCATPPGLSAAKLGEIWDAQVRARAMVLDEMASRRHAVGGGDPEAARLSDSLAAARKRYSELLVGGPGDQPGQIYRDGMEAARQHQEAAERALAGRSASFRRERERARIGLAEVAAALPSNSALVAYVRYSHLAENRPGAAAQPDAVPRYAAFVRTSRDRSVRVVAVGDAERIDSLLVEWSSRVAHADISPAGAQRIALSECTSAGIQARRATWDPVVPLLKGSDRVFIVPDGRLDLVNLAALPLDDGRYLVEAGPLLHLLGAERDLVPVQGTTRPGRGLLALGDPDFDRARTPGGAGSAAPAEDSTFRSPSSPCLGRFASLPGSGAEVAEIGALWRKDRSGPATEQDEAQVLTLTGADATEAALKRLAPGRKTVHLATHGFFLSGPCGDGAAVRGPSSVPAEESPLLLSGFAMAGANDSSGAGRGEEDGILTAEEIASLDLQGVEWAVLSGCKTGVGRIKPGEGVIGLRRAFAVAGARSVIMSLWPVEDESARQWMTALYRHRLVEKLGTAQAVRAASLDVLRSRRARGQSASPFYWAAFIGSGDWR